MARLEGGRAEPPRLPRPGARNSALAMVREICLALPGASERPSHGSPAFFIDDKHTFVMFLDDHHGDGGARAVVRCRRRAPRRCSPPPTPTATSCRPTSATAAGSACAWNATLTRDEVAGVIEDAWLDRAPKRRLAELDDASGSTAPGDGCETAPSTANA